ncbi:hypothetical protein O181_010381 [Austropuccinia psidii MF-1]|uniref:Uncharacterized protein n=1 Tax=Austropuccinia psidii MF-1 TaxID=1389203 RepID=A0A9Q3GKC8_9BASI|nr:hypothetical protein [Austropuccinia psidii MF-1]
MRLNGCKLHKPWRTYKKKYVDTVEWKNSTGSGNDINKRGSLHDELERGCPFFEHMDRIFSDKQKVAESHVLDTMIYDSLSIYLEGNNSTYQDSDVEIVYQDQNKTNSHFTKDGGFSESPELEYLDHYNVNANNKPCPDQVMTHNNLKNTLSDGSTIEKKSL